MKTLFFLLVLALPIIGTAQTTVNYDPADQSWDSRISASFYRRISDGRKFDCCEAKRKSKSIEVTVNLPDQCYSRSDFDLKRYSEESIDSAIIERTVDALDKEYRRKFSARKRAKVMRSCFSAYLSESIIEDLYQDAVFISGQLKIVVCLQTD